MSAAIGFFVFHSMIVASTSDSALASASATDNWSVNVQRY